MSTVWTGRRTVGLALEMSQRIGRVARGVERFAEGFALQALSDTDLHVLTSACYARLPSAGRAGLFAWEEVWLRRELPERGPILLGGAGCGPELRWLQERGHEVVAFDPVPRHDPRGGADLGVLELAYEDLADGPTTPVRRASLAGVEAGAPYAAIVLGWGSVTHVAGDLRRQRLLRALRQLSEGPVLMSFWGRSTGPEEAPGRAHRVGRRVGRLWRQPTADDRSSDRVVAHAGYGHAFSASEIGELAGAAGYLAECAFEGYPHATLRPR